MNTNKTTGVKPAKKLTIAEYVALGYRVVVKNYYLNIKKERTADVVIVKGGETAVYFRAIPVDENIPIGARHLTLAEYVSLGFTVKVKRFYVSDAGLPAADVILEKRGEKTVYLKGVYGKDEHVPGGHQYRFGKTMAAKKAVARTTAAATTTTKKIEEKTKPTEKKPRFKKGQKPAKKTSRFN